MQVKKCIALFASAAFAMLTLAGCGGADHSELAARTVNAAQGETISVEFTTDRDLTQSLKDALKDTTSAGELIDAIYNDEDLTDLLTNGVQVGAYTADSQQSPEEAAQQIAERILTNLSGKQDKGYITMVETENGSYYAIALFYRTGSGSGNGSGGSSDSGSDDDNTGGNTDPENPGGGEAVIVYNYTINSNSDVEIEPRVGTIGDGSDLSFTVTPDYNERVVRVTVNGKIWKDEPSEIGKEVEYTLKWEDIIPEYNGREYNVNIVVTVATVSEYGESQYLTKNDFAMIERTFESIVETTRNKKVGTNDEIQEIMNNEKDYISMYLKLSAKKDDLQYNSLQYIGRFEGENATALASALRNMRMVGSQYDEYYMTIKDTADGKVECYVICFDLTKTL